MSAFGIESYQSRGWYFVEANLEANQPAMQVWAVIQFDSVETRIPLSASLKGRVLELLPRPRAPHRFSVEVHLGGASWRLPAGAYTLRRLSGISAQYRLWRRILSAYPWGNKRRAERLGLGRSKVLFKPFSVYRTLGALRYHYPPLAYEKWRDLYWQFTPKIKRRLLSRMKQCDAVRQTVPVMIDRCGAGEAYENDAITPQIGVRTTSYSLSGRSEQLPEGLDNDWVLLTRPTNRLEPWALAWFLFAADNAPHAVLVYSDHALLNEQGKPVAPRFKPDWSPEMQRVSHYVGDCVLVRADALRNVTNRLGYVPGVYELTLELSANAKEHEIHHVPAVLWHEMAEESGAVPYQLAAHFRRHGVDATIEKDVRGQVRIRYGLPARKPKISIVIPTRDALHLLKPCVDSILARTTWPDYEILVLDNQSSCPETLAYLQDVAADGRVRVLPYNHPFNYSAINNFAVERAQGALVCLLNNDTEVISPNWLEEMASRLLQPDVGAVGARLYFADGRVQHAGDVLGPGGCACHLHGVIEADDPGYMNRAILPQELSAVTGACLLTHRSLYQELGGLDEANLPVAFNDVDFCLRIREAGYRVVYTPYAELYHYESVSRGKDDDLAKQARAKRETAYMRERWADVIERDPFYNPNLNYAKPDFTLGKYPRIDWPW